MGTRVHHECPYALASFSECKGIPESMELVSLFASWGSQFVHINKDHIPGSIELVSHLVAKRVNLFLSHDRLIQML